MASEATAPLRFATLSSLAPDAEAALTELLHDYEDLNAARPPDLGVLFCSIAHVGGIDRIAKGIFGRLRPKHLVGCTGESIIADGQEIEQAPAIALWLGWFEATQLVVQHLQYIETGDGPSFVGWSLPPDVDPTGPLQTLVLGEPFSFPMDRLLTTLGSEHPRLLMAGGMASGARFVGENRLIHNDQVLENGALIVQFHGHQAVHISVSQGCRPIGKPFVVTKVRDHFLVELGGRPALEQLKEVLDALPQRDRTLVQRGLHVGRVVNEYQEQFTRGDFLIRNVLGADPQTGVIAVGDYLRAGQTIQFHLRDAASADDDLRETLRARPMPHPAAGLLFTCNGRGQRLFEQPDHDIAMIRDELGNIPICGFFAQGEIGPIGGKNFLHGFTASLMLFE